MAATASRDYPRYGAEETPQPFGVKGSTTIYRGTLVGTNSSGYLLNMSDASGLNFAGVSEQYVVNGGSDGDVQCRAYKTGNFLFAYAGGDATAALLGKVMYAQDNETVDEDASLTTNDYPVGVCVQVISPSLVRIDIGGFVLPRGIVSSAAIGTDAVGAAQIAAGAVGTSELATGGVATADIADNPKTQVVLYPLGAFAAGADQAATAIWQAPAAGAELVSAYITFLAAPAGVDDANTAVIQLTDGAGNNIVTATYNTASQPPAADTPTSLGELDATHKILTAREIVKLVVTQGATADIAGGYIQLEWKPTA